MMNVETTEQIDTGMLCGLLLFNHINLNMLGMKKPADFKEVYRRRDLRADKLLVLYKLQNNINENRIGISVSKKVGNSVVRHRLKRQIREIARLRESMLLLGYDLIVVLRPAAKGMPYSDLENSFIRLAKRHRILAL